MYEDMKQRYGPQGCYLLKINSRSDATGADEQMPDPWSQYLHKTSIHNPVSTTSQCRVRKYKHWSTIRLELRVSRAFFQNKCVSGVFQELYEESAVNNVVENNVGAVEDGLDSAAKGLCSLV